MAKLVVKVEAFRFMHTFPPSVRARDRSTPGQGHVAWDETFDAIKKTNWDGWMVVEAFGLALPAIVAATKIWRKMYSTEEQLASDALQFMKTNVDKRWK